MNAAPNTTFGRSSPASHKPRKREEPLAAYFFVPLSACPPEPDEEARSHLKDKLASEKEWKKVVAATDFITYKGGPGATCDSNSPSHRKCRAHTRVVGVRGSVGCVLALVGALLALALGTESAAAVSIVQHPLPPGASPATAIFNGPGGLVVGEVTKNRSFDHVATGPPFSVTPGPIGREAARFGLGPDGYTWFLTSTLEQEPSGGQVVPYAVLAEDTPSGIVPRFKYASPWDRPSTPVDFATGSDGALWIADTQGHAIERYSLNGKFTEYPLPNAADAPVTIVAGPDGALWFTNISRGAIGRITTSGEITEYLIGESFGMWGFSQPYGLTVGPDGALWFTEQLRGSIGRITTGGQIQEFGIPNRPNAQLPDPREIMTGREGVMWFTDPGDEMIGRITIGGEVTEYPIPAANVGPNAIAQAANGELVFTESNANALGSVNPSGASPIPTSRAGVSVHRVQCAKPQTAAGNGRTQRGHHAARRTAVCARKTSRHAQRHHRR